MGLRITLEAFQNDDAVFDGIPLLNSDLDKTNLSELWEGNGLTCSGFVKYDNAGGEMEFANFMDGYDEGYSTIADVYGCFGQDALDMLAKHLISGKLVLMLDIEGNDNEYFVITPGFWEEKRPSF